jgi:hypothetical protein
VSALLIFSLNPLFVTILGITPRCNATVVDGTARSG